MVIDVTYDLASTSWGYSKILKQLEGEPLLSLDTETRGVYSKDDRDLASKLLKTEKVLPSKTKAEYRMISNNSGLSFPSLVQTTHFIFGLSSSRSAILVTPTPADELRVWEWIKNFKGKFLIHNTLFDLKIMYHRVKAFPLDYIDTALFSKCLLNDANNFNALVGLKELVGSHYSPAWSEFNSYEPENLLDTAFLDYAAIDGAAVIKLWEIVQDHLEERQNDI